MATGDIKNNLRKLRMELKKVAYDNDLDLQQMTMGVSTPFLPILHHVFSEFSFELSTYFHKKGYELFGKNDLRFLEIIYKILIQEFSLRPMLTKQQFFAVGYAEIKIIFVTKIVALCWQKNQELVTKSSKKKVKPTRSKVSDQKSSSMKLIVNRNNSEALLLSNFSSLSEKTYDNKVQAFVEKHFDDDGFNQEPKSRLPSSDLLLTSIKETSMKEKDEGLSNNLCCSLLDVTELEDELECNSQVDSYADLSESPHFVITRHEQNGFLPLVQNVVCAQNEKKISTLEQISTNQGIKVTLPQASQDIIADEHCKTSNKPSSKKCDCDSSEIPHLKMKINVLEKQVREVITVNHEMSAKMILMEMKVQLLESLIQKSSSETFQNEGTDNEVEMDHVEPLANNVNPSHDAIFTDYGQTDGTSQQIFSDVVHEYSPIKYMDQIEDEPLFRNFKPLHLKDVIEEEKENFFSPPVSSLLKDNLNLKPNNFSKRNAESFSIHDNETQEVLKNVKQKLMETERLLKTTTNG